MTDEIIKEEVPEENTGAEDYIQKIQELKANSVSKADFDKLKEENKQLLNALVDGKEIEMEQPAEKPDIRAIEAKLFDTESNLTNLDYAKLSLLHRAAVLEERGIDEYLPYGDKLGNPTEEDKKASQKVVEALEHCIDYADGDPQLFQSEFDRILIDNSPRLPRRVRR